jgi:hypothetical protein
MPESPPKKRGELTAAQRQAREAEKLRENLRKRKAQARAAEKPKEEPKHASNA